MCFTLLNVFCMLDEPEFGVGLRRNGGEEMRGSEKYYLSCRKKNFISWKVNTICQGIQDVFAMIQPYHT